MSFALHSLELTNFRGFEELKLQLDPSLNVLVGTNGQGKTAVLEAISIALFPFVEELGSGGSHGIARADIRQTRSAQTAEMIRMLPVTIRAQASIAGRDIEWKRELLKENGRTTRADAKPLIEFAGQLNDELKASITNIGAPPVFPLIAYYGTGRLWTSAKVTQHKGTLAGDMTRRSGAYLDCLSATSTYDFFRVWFERISREALNESATGVPSPHRPSEKLEAIQRAVEIVLRPVAWTRLRWDFMAHELVAEHPEYGRLSIDSLSDGIRTALAMTADLAHRAVRLNPQFSADACTKTPGIVLIDEVDLHLHPDWQQTILDSLRAAFPLVQFIVTTHSPQVLSTVHDKHIRIIEQNGEVFMPRLQTRGLESSSILAQIMNVNATPDVEEARLLSDYRALIEDSLGQTPKAQALRERLIQHFGETHPLMIECNQLQRFVDLRNRRFARHGDGDEGK